METGGDSLARLTEACDRAIERLQPLAYDGAIREMIADVVDLRTRIEQARRGDAAADGWLDTHVA